MHQWQCRQEGKKNKKKKLFAINLFGEQLNIMCDMIWSMDAKVGKCETEIQAEIGSKKTRKT